MADDIADGIMVHVIVMVERVAMADGIVTVHGIVMDGIVMADGIGMVHVIDIVVAEDRCMVQLGDTLGVPVGPGLALAGAARAVREIAAAVRAAAAMRRERMVLSSAGRGLGGRVRGIRHTEMKASC
ncbi:hypothetical protein ACWGI9_22885 [Streptomyces sp. NPDC054833]